MAFIVGDCNPGTKSWLEEVIDIIVLSFGDSEKTSSAILSVGESNLSFKVS